MIKVNKAERTIKNNIKRYGKTYKVIRELKDLYGEFDHETAEFTVKALYHETNGYINYSPKDGGIKRSKKHPMLLYCMDDNLTYIPDFGDIIIINGKKFKVIDCEDIAELDTFCEISLEVM